MQTKLDAQNRNRSWTSILHPKDHNLISRKWLPIKKIDACGIVIDLRHMALLDDFHKIHGVKFQDRFETTLMMVPLCAIFSIYVSIKLDINTTFLHGDLNVEIYMEQPTRFADPRFLGYACKLHNTQMV